MDVFTMVDIAFLISGAIILLVAGLISTGSDLSLLIMAGILVIIVSSLSLTRKKFFNTNRYMIFVYFASIILAVLYEFGLAIGMFVRAAKTDYPDETKGSLQIGGAMAFYGALHLLCGFVSYINYKDDLILDGRNRA